MSDAIVVDGLVKRFARSRDDVVVAAAGVSFAVPEGSTFGLVGESGSGKSTVARCVLGLLPADGGRVDVLGREVTSCSRRELRSWRRDMQIVFQEPYEALNPRRRVERLVGEPLRLHTDLRGSALRERVLELLQLVNLRPEHADRLPHQLSGGQQQRVNIARALATSPRVVVLDEPTSSLDVSVRADILKLLLGLQERLGLTYLMISHDLPTIRRVCDRVGVMYRGSLVEVGASSAVLADPLHPYTRLLLSSEMSLDPRVATHRRAAGVGALPVSTHGCAFADRCPVRIDRCTVEPPPLVEVERGHLVACVHSDPARGEGGPS